MRVITPRLSSTGSLNRTGAGLDMLRGALGDLVRIETKCESLWQDLHSITAIRAQDPLALFHRKGGSAWARAI